MRVFRNLTPITVVLFFVLLLVINRKSKDVQTEDAPLPKEIKESQQVKQKFKLAEDVKDNKINLQNDYKNAEIKKERDVGFKEKKIARLETNEVKEKVWKQNDEKINKVLDTEDMKRNEEMKLEHLTAHHLIQYRQALQYEEHLQEIKKTFVDIVQLARKVSNANINSKFILLDFVSENNIAFANNWLCNTKVFNLHSSVLFVMLDGDSKSFLDRNWPQVSTFALQPKLNEKTSKDSSTTFLKLQIINSLLHAGIDLLLFDVESVWLENPVPGLKSYGGYDMLVVYSQMTQAHFNTGLIVLFATEKTQNFWRKLYEKLRASMISLNRSDQGIEGRYESYLRRMLFERSAGIDYRELPITSYTEGMWYMLSPEEKQKTHPIVIRQNYILGYTKKVERAVKWKHWFIKNGGVCDFESVKKAVHILPNV